MLQTLLWISRLEKTFGKNSSKSGQKYFAKCASYTSNYIESKSASIKNIFFPIYYLVHQMQNLQSWNYESWSYFHRWFSNTWKLAFSISCIIIFVCHYLDSRTKNRFEQIKTNIKFCVIKFWIKRYKIGFSSGEQVIY